MTCHGVSAYILNTKENRIRYRWEPEKILKFLLVILCPFFSRNGASPPSTGSAEQWTHLTYQATRKRVCSRRLSLEEAATGSTCSACSSGTPPTRTFIRTSPRSHRFIIATRLPFIRMIIARSRARTPSRPPYAAVPAARAT